MITENCFVSDRHPSREHEAAEVKSYVQKYGSRLNLLSRLWKVVDSGKASPSAEVLASADAVAQLPRAQSLFTEEEFNLKPLTGG